MKYQLSVLLLFCTLLFTACSSKNEININKEIKSFSLDNNIVIAKAPRTVKSPVSIGLGLGGYVFKHVGVHVGTTIRPDIKNTEALNLEKGIALYNIPFSSLIKNEFKKQMKNDSYYKHKFVPFGANHTIQLYVSKYILDSSLLSSKDAIKVYMEIKVLNHKDELVYSNSEVNSIDSKERIYSEKEILGSKSILEKSLNKAISNTISKLILNMKKS